MCVAFAVANVVYDNEAEINQSANILLIEGTLCTGRPLYRTRTVVRADDKRRARVQPRHLHHGGRQGLRGR